MVLPERLEQQLRGGQRGVIRDEHGLSVSRATAAHLLVGRVGGVAAHVPDRGGDHAGQLPEDALGTPEATHRDIQDLGAVRPGTQLRRCEHLMTVEDVGQSRTPSGQGVVGCGQGALRGSKHSSSLTRFARAGVRRREPGVNPVGSLPDPFAVCQDRFFRTKCLLRGRGVRGGEPWRKMTSPSRR